ncbi:MAG: hypothetical protein M0R06_22680 [Sphaerochaeta sp.]|jgi:hypothetical protein|nr:hypothetical protein [Sphaerochaeta sp.]
MSEWFFIIKENGEDRRYELGPSARYAQDFETIRIWDDVNTYVVNPSCLVALCVRNQGPVRR